MVVVYILFLALFLLFMFLTRKVEAPPSFKGSRLQLPFEKMAIFLFQFIEGKERLRRILTILCPGAVKADLKTLDPSLDYDQNEREYFVGKIQYVLLFSFLADILAIGISVSQSENSLIGENMSIVRPGYDESAFSTELTASDGTTEIGDFEIEIDAQQYTEAETKRKAGELFSILQDELKGDNPSVNKVSENLVMPSSKEGYPFKITWTSSRYELVDTKGNVSSDKLETGESAKVTLTATLSYLTRKYEKSFDVIVVRKKLSSEEQFASDLLNATAAQNEKTAEQPLYYLPDKVDGKKIIWSQKESDLSLPVFLLILISGFVYYRLADRELHTKVEQRKQQLQMDYPQVLGRLVLLVGAGMSVRSCFEKMAKDYLIRKKKGGTFHYAYEEIVLMCHEIESGVSELDALSHFGSRCGLLSYSRFCSLLSQNLKKGNNELLTALRGEAEEAYVERKNLARQMGEEAGTKLLFPMILMLVVTMVMIMIPAYSSFTM